MNASGIATLRYIEAIEVLEEQAALREAGITFRSLTVTQDPSRGMVTQVEVGAAASPDAARRVLGGFSLPFEIT